MSETLVPGRPTIALRALQLAFKVRLQRGRLSRFLHLLPERAWGGACVSIDTECGPVAVRLRDPGAYYILFAHQKWERGERTIMKNIARECAVMFDIGANYGMYTIMLAQASPRGRVYAFEPEPGVFEYLSANTVSLANVSCHRSAVGRVDESGTLWTAEGSDLNSITREVGVPSDVDIVTLDRFCREHAVPRIDLIKCDVEGAETDVLLGAESVLRSSDPPIWMMEAIEDVQVEAGNSFGGVLDILRASAPDGKIYSIGIDGSPTLLDDWREGASKNILFVPPGRQEQFDRLAMTT